MVAQTEALDRLARVWARGREGSQTLNPGPPRVADDGTPVQSITRTIDRAPMEFVRILKKSNGS